MPRYVARVKIIEELTKLGMYHGKQPNKMVYVVDVVPHIRMRCMNSFQALVL